VITGIFKRFRTKRNLW